MAARTKMVASLFQGFHLGISANVESILKNVVSKNSQLFKVLIAAK